MELEPELENLEPELELELRGQLEERLEEEGVMEREPEELEEEREERRMEGCPNLLPELRENWEDPAKERPWGLERVEERRRSRRRWLMVGREGETGGRGGGGWEDRYRYRVTQSPLHGIYRAQGGIYRLYGIFRPPPS